MRQCLAGVDFGKTNVRFAIQGDGPDLAFFAKQAYRRGSRDEMLEQVYRGIDMALQASGCSTSRLRGIGLAVPAVVSRETGAVVWGPDWEFLAGASLTKPISNHYGVPVVADVDTVMATWGEHDAGTGRLCKRFAVVTWGTGLGGGLVIDGKVQEHPDSLFPEFGHSRVSDDDWPCKCGAVGCVDTMVCGSGIARHGQIAVESGRRTILAEMCHGNPNSMTSHMVFEAAGKGDPAAAAILDRVAVLLGRLCANVVLTVQPEKIVFVGGLAERCGTLLPTMSRTMRDSCWLLFRGLTKCEIVVSDLGDTAGVRGAICKARRSAARSPNGKCD